MWSDRGGEGSGQQEVRLEMGQGHIREPRSPQRGAWILLSWESARGLGRGITQSAGFSKITQTAQGEGAESNGQEPGGVRRPLKSLSRQSVAGRGEVLRVGTDLFGRKMDRTCRWTTCGKEREQEDSRHLRAF